MPPERRIAQFLRNAGRRANVVESSWIVAAACGAGATYILARAWTGGSRRELIGTAVAVLLAAAAAIAVRMSRRAPAADVERRTDVFNNALITSAEILRGDAAVKPHIRELVLRDTVARAERVDLRAMYPAVRPAFVMAAAVGALVLALALGITRPEAAGRARAAGAGRIPGLPSISRVDVTITPPAYAKLQGARLSNPDRLEMVEGSRLAFHAEANAGAIALDTGGPPIAMTRAADGAFAAEITATSQTFVTLTPSSDVEGPRHLIAITVTPDRAPDVRIGTPGRDLFLAGAGRDIPVEITARDDFGVTSLTLAYTKVSGSGETFEFVEGTFPLTLARASERELTGRAVIRPAALGLAPGDMLVYRAIARDAHPSRGPVESDAFVIEMVSPSEAMAEGFSIDDRQDKYALSQQMVILKTERLLAARAGMTPEAVAEEAARIGAEQRQVRAEFVFMMGGEVEDEEVEAEQSNELEEGREQNRGRRDLLAAIRNMSDASALLLRPDLQQALEVERRALAALQRALTRSRYILRVLAPRERIDDARRLSGDRSTAATWRRPRRHADAAPAIEHLRAAALQLSLLARLTAYGAEERAALTRITEDLLRSGSSDPSTREAVALLARAARTGEAAGVARFVDDAAIAIGGALEAAMHASVAVPPAARVPGRVRSALADRLRGGAR